MKNYSAFDIIGPIMIGPSSSHTAGAARLAKIAAIISGDNIKEVKFLLHGSFAKTYRGHGTDRALLAGILKMDPWDERLRNSFEIAEKEGIKYKFEEADLGEVHPNTVKFIITKEDGKKIEILGSSIGGGSILISEVDGHSIEFRGDYPTIILEQTDTPGLVSKVSTLLFNDGINIGTMKLYRMGKGQEATMTFETDSEVSEDTINKIRQVEGVENVKVINPNMEGEE